jgi:hypothetical protein
MTVRSSGTSTQAVVDQLSVSRTDSGISLPPDAGRPWTVPGFPTARLLLYAGYSEIRVVLDTGRAIRLSATVPVATLTFLFASLIASTTDTGVTPLGDRDVIA